MIIQKNKEGIASHHTVTKQKFWSNMVNFLIWCNAAVCIYFSPESIFGFFREKHFLSQCVCLLKKIGCLWHSNQYSFPVKMDFISWAAVAGFWNFQWSTSRIIRQRFDHIVCTLLPALTLKISQKYFISIFGEQKFKLDIISSIHGYF